MILSGGQGSRMGGDKGLVELNHAPLVSYVANVLSTIADEVIVSVAKGKRDPYSRVLGAEFRFVEDEHRGIGPLEGLVRGFEAAQGDYVLVSPCDTPFLKKVVCEAVVEAAQDRDGAVPQSGRKLLEPLHGAYLRDTCYEAFRLTLTKGDRTPTHAYEDLDIVYLNDDDVRALDPDMLSFWNINSPGDLKQAEAQLARLR